MNIQAGIKFIEQRTYQIIPAECLSSEYKQFITKLPDKDICNSGLKFSMDGQWSAQFQNNMILYAQCED